MTGAFGTVGQVTVLEALSRGHAVTAFARCSSHNRRIARRFTRRIERDAAEKLFGVYWGDVRDLEDLRAAVAGHDAVIHLASVLPPQSEERPDLCEEVNVWGTKRLLEALEEQVDGHLVKPALVYASSVSVMGPTQNRNPPLSVHDQPRPSDNYSASKVRAEESVKSSAVPWAILRLSAVMPTRGSYRPSLLRLIFDMSLRARCEVVMDLDAAYALVQAAEDLCDGGAMRGKTVFVAGGEACGCQMSIEDMLVRNLAPVGLRLPRGHLFRDDSDSYYLDWYDTKEGQQLLGYQRHTVDDWQRLSFRRFYWLRTMLWPVRGLAVLYLGLIGLRQRAARGRRD